MIGPKFFEKNSEAGGRSRSGMSAGERERGSGDRGGERGDRERGDFGGRGDGERSERGGGRGDGGGRGGDGGPGGQGPERHYEKINDFSAVSITLASPNDIRSWSY